MIHSIKKKAKKFITKEAALMAFMTNQAYFIKTGHLTSSYVMLETGTIELTVHFDLSNPPIIPEGYKYSQKEITSHTYYSADERRLNYVRCLRLSFEY